MWVDDTLARLEQMDARLAELVKLRCFLGMSISEAAGVLGVSTRTLNRELIYDYQYAAAAREYGVVIWIDARDASDCPAVDAYRQSLIDGTPIAAPSPLTDCPPQFGNNDIYGGTYLDPTS